MRILKWLSFLLLLIVIAIVGEMITDNRAKVNFGPRKPFTIDNATRVCVHGQVSLLLKLSNTAAHWLGTDGHFDVTSPGISTSFSHALWGAVERSNLSAWIEGNGRPKPRFIANRGWRSFQNSCTGERDLNVVVRTSLTERYKLLKIVAIVKGQGQSAQVVLRYRPEPRYYGPFGEASVYGFELKSGNDLHTLANKVVEMIDQKRSVTKNNP